MLHSSTRSGRGAFIVFEGLDRSGKSTQSKLIHEELLKSNIPSLLLRFPDRSSTSELGPILAAYLEKGKDIDPLAVHMLFTTQRFLELEKMKNLLEAGTTLIVDRYAHSGIAYTVAKGIDVEWCKDKERSLLQPDLLIYMDISPEKGQERCQYGAERFENIQFQRNVYEAYKMIRTDEWQIVPAVESPDRIFQSIFPLVKTTIERCENLPLRTLYPVGKSDEFKENIS